MKDLDPELMVVVPVYNEQASVRKVVGEWFDELANWTDRFVLVAINDDDSIRRLKGSDRPIYPAGERAEILLALRWVDCVTVFPEDTPKETIELVRPHVLVKGAEYQEKDIVGAKFVSSYGGEVTRIRMKPGYSTRNLIRKVSGTGV